MLAAAVILGVAAPTSASADEERYKKAFEHYKERMRDDSLASRIYARDGLASTKDPRAFRILRRDYARPERPREPVRYLIAEDASIYFDTDFADAWREWMEDEKKARDAWLWFHGCRWCLRNDAAEILNSVDPREDVFLRAAAIEALAAYASEYKVDAGRVAQRILVELRDLPQGAKRGVIAGSLSSLALSLQPYLENAKVRDAVSRIIKQCDHPEMPAWARLAVARRIAKLTKMPAVSLRTLLMLDALEGASRPASPADEQYAPPTFMGVEATGTRIAYVIDCSDSMLTPLTGTQMEALRAAAESSRSSDKSKPARASRPIDWRRVRSRFDAAREFLKLSLARLTPDQSFAVVCFGTKAKILKRVPGMRPASKARVQRAMSALTSMKAGSGDKHRPHGRLLGDTNLHSAIRLAFRVVAKGAIEAEEHVDLRGFAEGCDTMFLLSDGAPTTDDYLGTRKGFKRVGGGTYDPETGTRTGSGGFRLVPGIEEVKGPYAGSGARWLEGDVRRMNMFRKVELHCIGLGDANKDYLKSLARRGLGSVLMLGK